MDDLYQEELMDIYKNPHNKGAIKNPSVEVSGKNPFCGDEVTLQLEIEDQIIKEAKFDGTACSVSIISSSLVTDYIKGKKVSDVKKMDKEKVLELLGLNLTTSRIACATLVLTSLIKAIEKYESGK